MIHAAAETHVDRSISGPAEFVLTNVVGTQVVLDACRTHDRPLLLVSTDEVYGQNEPEGTFDEGSPLRPRSPYAASKAAAELLARSYGVTYGLAGVRSCEARTRSGPRQNPEKAIPVFTTAALEGRPLPVYDDGRQSREWLYVTDWAAACIVALDHGEPGDVFNIGDGFELANVDLARSICRLVGADESLVTFVARPPGPRPPLRHGERASARTRLASRGAVRRRPRAHRRVVPGTNSRTGFVTMRAGAGA